MPRPQNAMAWAIRAAGKTHATTISMRFTLEGSPLCTSRMLLEAKKECNFPLSACGTIGSVPFRHNEDRQYCQCGSDEHRVAPEGEARFQAREGIRGEGTNQESRSVSADVSGIDQVSG